VRPPRWRILICDDHGLIRAGLKRIVDEGGMAGLVGEAANAPDAMTALRRERWHLVVLDINLGGRNGLEVLDEIAAEFPKLPVLVLSNYPEDQFAVRAIRAGARGYLNKNQSTHLLLRAIREVMAGKPFFSANVTAQLIAAVRQPGDRPAHDRLSDREDQVLRQIGAGRTVGEIAARLRLSVKTVSTYRAIVLRKLGLANNAQLMRFTLEHGLGE
jgi:DNA-binding NarL/FixJ family response regulator